MLKSLILTAIFAFSGSALADTQNLKVSGKDHFKGNNMVRLKRLANQQLQSQGLVADDYELVGVEVLAKSRRGHGQATLVVGPDQSTKRVGEAVGGLGGGSVAKLLWQATGSKTYNKLRWDISSMPGQSDERWQMRFQGNIKIRHIVLTVKTQSQRVRIPFGGELFTGQSMIALKRELRDMGYNVRRAKLTKVVLVAKSKRGRGQAELQVGPNVMGPRNVAASQAGLGFQNEKPRSYNRIRFRPTGNTRGKWQIHMRGRIKVKAVIVEFQ